MYVYLFCVVSDNGTGLGYESMYYCYDVGYSFLDALQGMPTFACLYCGLSIYLPGYGFSVRDENTSNRSLP